MKNEIIQKTNDIIEKIIDITMRIRECIGEKKGLFGKKKILNKTVVLSVLTIVKYLFSIIICFMTIQTTHQWEYSIVGMLELIIIAIFSFILTRINHIVGIVINDILMLIYNAEMLVLYFGNSYIMLVMLTNIDSLQDLSGKSMIYGVGIAMVLIFSLLPIVRIKTGKWGILNHCLSVALVCELCFTLVLGNAFSPCYAVYNVAQQEHERKVEEKEINNSANVTNGFYQAQIDDYYPKNGDLNEKPNVILIFTEGLSQNVIDDERNIMPNVAAFEKNCLNFTDYYNHTFATYRGISGQLYSGYQRKNLDENSLISMEDIFAENQYETTFINTEPINIQFFRYLEDLNFDKVIGDAGKAYDGEVNSMSDAEAYEQLFDTISEKEQSLSPYFVCMYTFGTHLTFDGVEKKYGDGSNRLFNKFYDLDYQFGKFLDAFNSSSLSDNTILVFTTDHATYADDDFMNSFPEYERGNSMLDEIPLCIYYKGMKPGTRSVEGRNSLDLAPTVFDYLDISSSNYFLGTSLFAPKQNNNAYDTIFTDASVYFDSDEGNVSELPDETRDIFLIQLRKYYRAKNQQPVALK